MGTRQLHFDGYPGRERASREADRWPFPDGDFGQQRPMVGVIRADTSAAHFLWEVVVLGTLPLEAVVSNLSALVCSSGFLVSWGVWSFRCCAPGV
jgi:hypothetical protein